MKKLCIVPYTKAEYSLLPFLEEEYVISALITPSGIGLEGQDISVLLNREPTKYAMTNMLEEGIGKSDVVLVSDVCCDNLSLYKYMKEALSLAIKMEKDIICCSELTSSEKKMFSSQCRRNGKHWHYVPRANHEFLPWGSELYTIIPPVLYIAEMIPGCDGYEVFLSLVKALEMIGKRVLAISNDKYNNLLGLDCLDWDFGVPLDRKCVTLNNAVHSIVEEKAADIVIVRLPYPLIKYDEKHPFDLGIMADYITNALPGSACIFCTLAGFEERSFWDGINSAIRSRFGFPIIAIHLSNKILDSTVSSDLNTVCIPHIDIQSFLSKMKNETSIPTYDLTQETDIISLSQSIADNYINLRYGVIE
mgnify:CR=1 FL=1